MRQLHRQMKVQNTGRHDRPVLRKIIEEKTLGLAQEDVWNGAVNADGLSHMSMPCIYKTVLRCVIRCVIRSWLSGAL